MQPLLWMPAYLPLLHWLTFAIPGVGVDAFERQTRRRVSARPAQGSSGYDATLGIVVDDAVRAQSASEAFACSLTQSDAARGVTPPQMLDESGARRKQIQDGGRRLAAFVDFNFCGGSFASYAPRVGAAADRGELPSLGAA